MRTFSLRRALGLALFLASLQLASSSFAFAVELSPDLNQYAHTAWRARDGFFKGVVSSIAQTPDGYLWIGTEFGLYRFDGVRAIPWQAPLGEQLPSNYIRNLLVARDGTLWIATQRGLASWRDGKLANYPETAGEMVRSLLEDHERTIWVGSDSSGKLCAIKEGKIQCDGSESFGRFVGALYEDRKGNLWVSGMTGLWRWKPGPPQHYSLPSGLIADALIEDGGGRFLVATSGGLKRFVNGKVDSYVVTEASAQFRPTRFFNGHDGSLWIGSHQGLFHLHQGKTDKFGLVDGLSGDAVTNVFEDREGSVWIATMTGLDRFREYAISTISKDQGISGSGSWAVQATPDGSVWIGTAGGLNRWQSDHMTAYHGPGTRGWQRSDEEVGYGRRTTKIADSGFAGIPRSLGLDDRGRLWASNTDGVFYFEDGRFIPVPSVPNGNIFGIAADGHGKVWISNDDLGLFHLAPGDVVQAIPWSRLGHKGFGALALLPDQADGGLWLGFGEGGITFFKDGQIRASLGAANGLGTGRVASLRFGSLGGLWAATEGGLSRFKDGKIETLTSKNGLPCDQVHWSIEDDDHAVWVFMPCGLVRIERSEWYAWVNNPTHAVKTTTFDSSDGVPAVGSYGGYGPHVSQSPDGKIWFVNPEGVSVIDPRHLPLNKQPPPVYVEQIMADGKKYGADSYSPNGLRLPPLVRNLTIDYTALSLAVPEKVHFRFKLEGQDSDWREVVNSRQVQYSNLPPKRYRFRVTASNNNGVWNEEGTFVDFSIAPAYYQTNWFRALCVAAFLGFLWVLYQYRLHQIQHQFNISFEARVNERLRIARDLHDTLLQSLQGLLLRFQTASNLLPTRPEEAKQKLDKAIDMAAESITEGRGAVQGLRSSATVTNELAVAVNALADELAGDKANQSAPVFRVDVGGEPRDLHPLLRDEVYRIAGEAMRNAFRHAQADRIEVEIHYDLSRLRLRIRDNGKGIGRDVIDDDGRSGHWGLHGMRERAKIIGGNLEVWSSAEAGTEVELTIPARIAYATAGQSRSWFSRKESPRSHE